MSCKKACDKSNKLEFFSTPCHFTINNSISSEKNRHMNRQATPILNYEFMYKPSPSILAVIWLKTSIPIIQRKGKRGSPSHKALEHAKEPFGTPFSKIEKLTEDTRSRPTFPSAIAHLLHCRAKKVPANVIIRFFYVQLIRKAPFTDFQSQVHHLIGH